jgi:citrate lyase subunit beta/citryl-CoA lyase
MPQPKPRELPLWRSQIIAPVNVERHVAKAPLTGADFIVLDLEDSITPPERGRTRTLVDDAAARAGLRGADVLVRINRPLQLAIRDTEAVVSLGICGLVLPKIETASHVQLLAEVAEAEWILAGFERAKAEGRESVSADGKMVDIPIVLRAQNVLEMDRRVRECTNKLAPCMA